MRIDAVITWVDGSDPAHQARLAATLQALGMPRPLTAAPTRFGDCGELEYCIASLVRYAPWFHTLHIVTDGQRPSLLATLAGTPWQDRVRIVDHAELFAGHERHLPTFNSRSIISMLWRTPGIAERFVYFNDDFALLRPVAPQDFFREDGGIVLRGKWRPQSARRWTRRMAEALKRLRGEQPDRAGNHVAQEMGARLAGFEDRYYRLYHNPFPFHRSTLEAWFAAHPAELESNIAHRFRSSRQFKTESLATHLEIARGTAVLDNSLRSVTLKPSEQQPWRLRRKLAQADRDPAFAFGCVQSLDVADEGVRATLVEWLERRVGSLRDALAGFSGEA